MEWKDAIKNPPPYPEDGMCELYLVYGSMGVFICKWYGLTNPDRPREDTGWKYQYPISHWMEIPEPPRK